MKKTITQKWISDLAVLYRVDNILLFFSAENDPKWERGKSISLEEAEQSKPYKALKYNMNNVPNDVSMDIFF